MNLIAPISTSLAALLLLSCSAPQSAAPGPALDSYDVVEKSLATLAEDLAAKRVTSTALVELYSARIRELDRHGPELRSVLALNPRALDAARTLDSERARGHVRGPLHGIPILIKDNCQHRSSRGRTRTAAKPQSCSGWARSRAPRGLTRCVDRAHDEPGLAQ